MRMFIFIVRQGGQTRRMGSCEANNKVGVIRITGRNEIVSLFVPSVVRQLVGVWPLENKKNEKAASRREMPLEGFLIRSTVYGFRVCAGCFHGN